MMDDMMTLYKRLFLASHKHFQNLIDLGKIGSLRQYSQHMAQPEAHQPQTLSVHSFTDLSVMQPASDAGPPRVQFSRSLSSHG